MAVREEIDFFLMANLSPRLTGLPFVVWISPRGNARHDVRIKISPGPKADFDEFVSVGVRPVPHLIEGDLSAADLRLLRQWITLNQDVLVRYWEGDIAYTEDVLRELKPIA